MKHRETKKLSHDSKMWEHREPINHMSVKYATSLILLGTCNLLNHMLVKYYNFTDILRYMQVYSFTLQHRMIVVHYVYPTYFATADRD